MVQCAQCRCQLYKPRPVLQPAPQCATLRLLWEDIQEEEDPLHEFLVRCIERGLILAPGVSSGFPYTHHVRLCFTSAHPTVVARGVDVLAELIGL